MTEAPPAPQLNQPPAVPSIPAPPPPHSRGTISAKAALGLDSDPSADVANAIEAFQNKTGIKPPVFETPEPTVDPSAAPDFSAPSSETPEPQTQPAETPETPEQQPSSEQPAETPEQPAETPETPEQQAPYVPLDELPDQIVIGDRVVTKDQLAALIKSGVLADPNQQQQAPQPSDRQHQPQEQPSSEERIRQRQEAEAAAIQEISSSVPLADADESTIEAILAGGQEAVTAFNNMRRQDAAHAVLEARKWVADNFNPIIQSMHQAIQPLVHQQGEVERYQAQVEFLEQYPDYKPHVEQARQVAEQLMQRYPDQVQQMDRQTFFAEVARQTDGILQTQYAQWGGQGNWRQGLNGAASQQPQQPAVQKPQTPIPPQQTAQAQQQPAVVAPLPGSSQPQPLTGNMPSSGGGPVNKPWQHSVANSLR